MIYIGLWLWFSVGLAMCFDFHKWNVKRNGTGYMWLMPIILIFGPMFYPAAITYALMKWGEKQK